MSLAKAKSFDCKHCKRKVYVNASKGFTQRLHEWLCHYQIETKKVQTEAEDRERAKTIKLENSVKRLELKQELVEKDIFSIKIDLQDANRQKIKVLEGLPVTPFEHDIHKDSHGDLTNKPVDKVLQSAGDLDDGIFRKPHPPFKTKKSQPCSKSCAQ